MADGGCPRPRRPRQQPAPDRTILTVGMRARENAYHMHAKLKSAGAGASQGYALLRPALREGSDRPQSQGRRKLGRASVPGRAVLKPLGNGQGWFEEPVTDVQSAGRGGGLAGASLQKLPSAASDRSPIPTPERAGPCRPCRTPLGRPCSVAGRKLHRIIATLCGNMTAIQSASRTSAARRQGSWVRRLRRVGRVLAGPGD